MVVIGPHPRGIMQGLFQGTGVGRHRGRADLQQLLLDEVDAEKGARLGVPACLVFDGSEPYGDTLLIAGAVEPGDLLGELSGSELHSREKPVAVVPYIDGPTDGRAGVVVCPQKHRVTHISLELPAAYGDRVAVAVHLAR